LRRGAINGRGWLFLTAAGIAAAAALWLLWSRPSAVRSDTESSHVETPTEYRIAVLPFENLSGPDDGYFAEGLTEEITKDLAFFPSLRVISRTSAMQYAKARKPLKEIGRELGATHILEGTVRWALGPDGKRRVRITPQLIRVSDDVHLWAAAFEREVEDIFKVQEEISRRVIGALGIALLPAERNQRPELTQNSEAYLAYLRGLALRNQPFYSEEHLRKAVPMFERAVALDPHFAVAWAELSQTHSYLAFNTDP
jgi:adenylate cyclase